MKAEVVDVVIIGGGLAGTSLAIQLLMSSQSIRIKVVEKIAGPLPEAAFKVGESTVEIGSHYFSNVLGLKDHLVKDQLQKFGFRYFFNGGRNSIENRVELGGRLHPPTGSWQIDRGRFETFLREKSIELGAEILTPARVRDVEFVEGGLHQVWVESKEFGTQEISAKWVIDASGRNSFLKRRLTLQKEVEHKCSASWFRVKGRFDVSDWSDKPEWKSWEDGSNSRWYSTNHLMGRGYWVWLIPLASDFTSVGIVAAQPCHDAASISTLEKSRKWLEEFEPQCAEKLAEREIVDFLYLKNFAYGCKQIFSTQRWALTGEAAVFLDPFYSPGSDFIAIGNTFITDLVLKDLNSQPIGARVSIYNDVFFRFFTQMHMLYNGQYPIFGNSAVMPLKVVWDYATYWTFMGALFFEERLTDIKLLSAVKSDTDRMENLNAEMQSFFRDWSSRYYPLTESGNLSFFRSDYLIELNRQLLHPGPEPFELRFKNNMLKLRGLAKEICDFALKNRASTEIMKGLYASDSTKNEPMQALVLNDFISDLGEALESAN